MRGQVVFVVLFLRSRRVSTLLLLLLSEQARLAFDDLGDVRDVPACAHGGALAGVVEHSVQQ